MFKKIIKWSRQHYSKIVGSIAFYPALIAIGFLVLSWVMLQLDLSEGGKELKGRLSWISLRDASTARSIISTIVGGLISLTVFSFSMVMIVLNQAASQMSNRVLDSMLENRKPQVILGIYIGSIVYGLFLLSTIRDTDQGIYIPAFSIYLLILLAIITIFLFIYFLDYITQAVKYQTVIQKVQEDTTASLKKNYSEKEMENTEAFLPEKKNILHSSESGYFQGINQSQLLQFTSKEDIVIRYLHAPATFVLKGNPLFEIYSNNELEKDIKETIFSFTDMYNGQPVEKNPNYGFQQLTEVAAKALSPGINDPATAVLCIHSLGSLFKIMATRYFPLLLKDHHKKVRIIKKTLSFQELFEICFQPIWQYGKEDFMVQRALHHILKQLLNEKMDDNYKDAIHHFMKKNNIDL